MSQELESKTRKKRVDKKLNATGWTVIPYSARLDTSRLTAHAVEEFPTDSGPADYALFVNGQLLGFLEAKRVSVGVQNVLEQAKRYSRTTFNAVGSWRGYRTPFLYSSNGELVYFLDVREERNIFRQLAGFHTPDALREMLTRDQNGIAWLQSYSTDEIEKLRPYQKDAIAATEDAISKGKRAMLVAMATGTGKTFKTVAQIYRLLESKSVKRVLFLVDRRALAAQAVRAFSSFTTPGGNKFNQEYELYSQRFKREDFGEDEAFDSTVLPNAYLTNPNETHTFVYVCTIQRMKINLFGQDSQVEAEDVEIESEDDAEKLDIPIHAFDLIVADECHRGYTAKETSAWRETLNYFDAIKIGLTATPAAHSLSLFKEVVYRYTTDQAIMDGWLVDYEPIEIESEVKINGAFLRGGEAVGIIDTETGVETYDELEDEREFASTEIERKITVPDTNRKIIKEVAKFASKHEQETGRFPKILIFAVNDLAHTSHADQIVQICKEEFGQGDDFVQKITGSKSVDRPLQKIREFRNRPNPKVVVTVDMLTTGVDIPSIEFVVFMRPVKSRILWVQMLGRGTRRCDEIHKTHFKIFDCFGGSLIEYFQNTSDFKIEPPRKDPVPLSKVVENIQNNVDRNYNLNLLVKRLQRVEHGMSGEGREQLSAYVPDGDLSRFARELPRHLAQDFTGTMNLLRDLGFQNLLLDYPKPPKTFLIGYGVEDTVTSRVTSRAGQYTQSPVDYLDTFANFVRENADQIEAIQILLARPQAWNTEALNQLRQALARHQFQEPELQKAHEQVHHKLADIISMVKRAIAADIPIYTAEERVNRALEAVMANESFTEEQSKWLGYIRQHLIENLSIEIDDFDNAPIFRNRGGERKASKAFQGRLEQLLEFINSAIAA
ncbi:DEAD/DEAH box helicase family protein [Trichocoleus sp. FACHB-262]|uniref:type I restriction endonuclease subunit R n=1 Tax=Trichocoleus sp. FACHB-262 TaxID=2692869 RepID=UPI00168632DF|nr:DEAD/DEAH box helicase family protein [Trichocoleus sp. FACHB-262]MBD2122886.1 DEAD/DEAH box helicase family protein [Trichocoleus sp. FACHB-262]